MSISVPKSKLKPKLLSYLRKVEKEKVSIIVTDRGHPVSRIIPFQEKKIDPLKELAGSILRYDRPLESVAEEDWELKP